MPARTWRSHRRRIVAVSALSALGWGGCEPLDLALFPVTEDASSSPVDIPEPLPAVAVDAGSDAGMGAEIDARGDAGSADAGSTEPPPAPCLPGAAACEACVVAESCAAGLVCHPFSGQCVPPCPGDAPQCPVGLVCGPLDVCVECTEDAQCLASDDDEPRCDLDRGVCVECLIDSHCTDDPFERPLCLGGGICGCDSDDDCSGGAICELDESHCEIEDD